MKALAITLVVAALGTSPVAVLAQKSMDDIKGMSMEKKPAASDAKGTPHTAKGTIKKIDAQAGVVTIAHGAVDSLKWPPMTMGFKVRDKALLSSLVDGKTVEFDFVQVENDYVIAAIR